MAERSTTDEENKIKQSFLTPYETSNPDFIKKRVALPVKSSLKLASLMGILSFGGPVAHIGLYHKYLVELNDMVDEKAFTGLFALCNILPGPTSSQLLTGIFLLNSQSVMIGLYSFICFNLPGLLALMVLSQTMDLINPSILQIFGQGIRLAAVALVFQALATLSRKILNSSYQLIISASAFGVFLFFNHYMIMMMIMLISGLCSFFDPNDDRSYLVSFESEAFAVFTSIPFLGYQSFALFLAIYGVILLLWFLDPSMLLIRLIESFYRMGSLVIGGGHVIIPMILSEFTHEGILTDAEVLDSFSLVSIMPGPMFNLAGYIGFKLDGILAGFLSSLAIFTPGMLMLFTGLGLMGFISKSKRLQVFLRGVSSASIGFIAVSVVILWVETIFGSGKKGGMGEFLGGAYKSLLVAFYYLLLEKFKVHILIVFGISLLVSIFIH